MVVVPSTQSRLERGCSGAGGWDCPGGFFLPFSAESRQVQGGGDPAEGDPGGPGKAKWESPSAPTGSWGTAGFCSEFHF